MFKLLDFVQMDFDTLKMTVTGINSHLFEIKEVIRLLFWVIVYGLFSDQFKMAAILLNAFGMFG